MYLVLGRVCCFYMNTFFFDSASFWCVVFKKFFRFKKSGVREGDFLLFLFNNQYYPLESGFF